MTASVDVAAREELGWQWWHPWALMPSVFADYVYVNVHPAPATAAEPAKALPPAARFMPDHGTVGAHQRLAPATQCSALIREDLTTFLVDEVRRQEAEGFRVVGRLFDPEATVPESVAEAERREAAINLIVLLRKYSLAPLPPATGAGRGGCVSVEQGHAVN